MGQNSFANRSGCIANARVAKAPPLRCRALLAKRYTSRNTAPKAYAAFHFSRPKTSIAEEANE
jgi:hypothetical protein